MQKYDFTKADVASLDRTNINFQSESLLHWTEQLVQNYDFTKTVVALSDRTKINFQSEPFLHYTGQLV